jgi:ATP synthase F1 delta subunit
MFTVNGGVGAAEVKALNNALMETAEFQPLTMKFLTILAENKRLVFIKEIAEKYANLYSQFNKEEKITIISAQDLTSAQQNQVLDALKANPENEGKQFTLEYKVDSNIVGGLQMYTESEFMDMSLVSRLNALQTEVHKLCN